VPRSIGIDWGTSSLRASLFDGAGRVLETRVRPWGIRSLPAEGFDAALSDLLSGWPLCPTCASGMVGSRQGWHEVPYVDAPANADALIRGLFQVRAANGRDVSIIPGVRDSAGPDVMRGEETQVIGALVQHPELAISSQMILPGTHSKWVDVADGYIVRFTTVMTGEIYALLHEHSILGTATRTTTDASLGEAFDEGVRAARASGNAGVLTRLFSARALMLEGRLDENKVSDYLSGLLIGEEWRSMLASDWLQQDRRPVLIGDERLCARYHRAAALFEIAPPEIIVDAAARGLWHIIARASVDAPPRAATHCESTN